MKKPIVNIGLLFLSTFLRLVFWEIILRGKAALKRVSEPVKPPTIPMHISLDSPILYGLNPVEDTLSIHVLGDESTPEWQWLTSIYMTLNDAVTKEQATLIVVLFPLAYQLDDGYPFIPQKSLVRFCREHTISCPDLLPLLKKYPEEDVFILDKPGRYDIWHLTEYGHGVSA